MNLAEILIAAADSPEEAVVDMVNPMLTADEFHRVLTSLLVASANFPHSSIILGAFGWLLDAILRFGFPDDVPAGSKEWGGHE